MTTPNDEPSYWFKMLFDKVDSIDRKIDGHSEKLVGHEIRLTALETGKKDNRAMWLAFAVAALAWVPDLIQLLSK